MGRARPDLIRVLEENPPGPHAGITLVRQVRTREYRTEIGPRGYLSQIEAAAFLGKSVMAVNRYVRLGLLRDTTRYGISMIQLAELRRFRRENLKGGEGRSPSAGKAIVSLGDRKDQGLRLEKSSAPAVAIEPLLTAAEVGRLLAIPTKRVYEVVGHLAIQLAPHTLRWRLSDIMALIEARRRSK